MADAHLAEKCSLLGLRVYPGTSQSEGGVSPHLCMCSKPTCSACVVAYALVVAARRLLPFRQYITTICDACLGMPIAEVEFLRVIEILGRAFPSAVTDKLMCRDAHDHGALRGNVRPLF